ncbi:hypothetical protein D3C80_1735810 [compost metagenome]
MNLPTTGSPASHSSPLLPSLSTALYLPDRTSARLSGKASGPLPSWCSIRLTKYSLSPVLIPCFEKLMMMSKRSAMPMLGRMALWSCTSPSASRSMLPSNGTACSIMLPSLAIKWNGTRV